MSGARAMPAPTFGDYYGSERNLCCPKCGSDCHHSGRVTVFDRAEDEERARVVAVGGGVVIRDEPSDECANPSTRRHGIAIQFWCEECRLDAELTLAQHKGVTVVAWREVPR